MGSVDRAIIVEVHKGWCGPSAIMLTVFQRWYLDLNNADERVAFVGADPEKVQAVAGKSIGASASSCMPVFLVLRDKNIAGKVIGLDAPELKRVLDIAIPAEPT